MSEQIGCRNSSFSGRINIPEIVFPIGEGWDPDMSRSSSLASGLASGFCWRRTGTKVSGRNMIGRNEAPAMAKPIQYGQFQPSLTIKPDTTGAGCGPATVVLHHLSIFAKHGRCGLPGGKDSEPSRESLDPYRCRHTSLQQPSARLRRRSRKPVERPRKQANLVREL